MVQDYFVKKTQMLINRQLLLNLLSWDKRNYVPHASHHKHNCYLFLEIPLHYVWFLATDISIFTLINFTLPQDSKLLSRKFIHWLSHSLLIAFSNIENVSSIYINNLKKTHKNIKYFLELTIKLFIS